jgi:Domain of unknown function (DUF4347)/Bacterial Ig domain/Bacterial cadherin-like domain
MGTKAERTAKPAAAAMPAAGRSRASVRKSPPVPRARSAVRPTPIRTPSVEAPFTRRAVFEELESRLLMSADLNPLAQETLLAAPALQGAEFRALSDDESVVTKAAVAALQRTNEVIFIDPRVADRERLLAGLTAQSVEGRHFEIIALDANRDGIAQVTEALSGRIQVDAVHFITHGADGAVQLGGTSLAAKTLAANADAVAKWGDSLKKEADLLFYGCDFAASARGRALVEWIAELTRGDVAASTDVTGSAAQGGDWELEYSAGVIETNAATSAIAQAQWDGLLSGVPSGAEFRVNATTPDPDVGALIRVAVSYTDGGGMAESLTSAPVGPMAAVNDARVNSVPGTQSTVEVVISTDTAAVRRTAEIAFVDTATPDYARLVEGLRETALAAGRDLEVVLIDRDQDGLRAITDTLARKTGLDAVHIISHGEAGAVQLGHARLDFVSLAARAAQIKGWGQALGADADLFIYGCNVAATAEGRSLVDALARLTGADVAASDDFTGTAALGGDWILEYRRGQIENSLALNAESASAWQGILAQTFYLGGDTTPPFSDLETAAPTDAVWDADNNYDPGRDAAPGLVIQKDNASASQSDPAKHHTWTALAPAGGIDIANEQVTLSLWSAMKDNTAGKDGTVTAYLLDLATATATSGTLISQSTVPLKRWSAPFAEESLDFGTINYTVAAGRYLAVKVVVGNTSDDDLWFAYDATAYPSRLQIGVNDAPVASDVSASGSEDDPQIAITLTGSDVDDPIASFRLAGLPANGTLYTDAGLITLAVAGSDYAAAGNALTLYFVPAADWNGTTGFQFTATDAGGLSDATPATATINVTAVNDAPEANDVGASGSEDDASIAITLTGTDIEGPIASFRLAGLPANGLLYADAGLTTLAAGTDYAAAGDALTLYFAPAANWSGTTGFQFTATDGGGLSDATPASATIDVAPVNDAPAASDVTANGAEDDASIAIVLVGSDVDDAIATFRITGALPANGTFYTDAGLTTAAASGVDYAATANALTLYFVPAGDWNGTTSFQYTATDGGGQSDATPATATINVAAVNDSPAAVADAAATDQDTPVTTGDVLANDVLGDQPSTIVTFDAASAQGGTVAAGAVNTFVYTPAAAFSGTDTFTYTLRDADGETSTATVTVTVANLANDPPVNIVPGAQISAEDVALVFSTANGNRIAVSDPDAGANPLEVTLTAVQGTLTLAGTAGLTFTVGTATGDATMTFTGIIADINAALDGMSFLPPLDYTGAAAVTITTGDFGATGAGGPQSDSDTVVITVNAVDDAPVLDLNDSVPANGVDYAQTFTEGSGSVRIADFDANLTDTDSANLASLTVTITNLLDGPAEVLSADTTGTTITATFVPGSGVLTLNGADTVANYQTVLRTVRYDNTSEAPTATPRVITFVASDGASASNVGTATVTVIAVNDDPVATITAASYTATENVGLDLHGTGMAVSDIDALTTSVVTVYLDSISGLLSATAGTTGVTIAGSGSPSLTFTGTIAQINSLLAGGGGGTIAYLVGSDSPAPTDTLSLAINDMGATGAGGARWGWDSVTVNLIAVNDAPLITIPGTATTAEDTPLVFSAGAGNQISITDVDAAGTPVEVALSVTNGTLSLAGTAGLSFTAGATGSGAMTFTGTVAAINAALDGLAFAPTADYNGPAFLSLTVNDLGASGLGGPLVDSDFASITVTPANDAPDGADATVTTPQDTPYVFGVANFGITDGDAGDTLAAVRIDALPAAGALTLSGGAVSAGQVIAVADIAAGNLVFTPALGGTGAPYASFAFSVQDSGGAFDASPNTHTVNVATPVNNAPSGTNGVVTTAVSTDNVFTLADFGYSDPDAGDAFGALRIDTLPSPLVGTLYFGALAFIPGVHEGTVVSAAGISTGNLYFRPIPLLPGSASFDFSVRDTNGPAFDAAPNTMTVNVVVPANDPVNVVPGAVTADEDTAIAIGGIAVNDPNGDLASVQLGVASGTLGAVAAGTAVVAGAGTNALMITGAQADINATLASLVYLGNTNFAGADTLTITSTDATALTDADSVAITVNPVNDAPTASAPAAYAATEQVMAALTGLAVGDVDAGGNPVTVTLSAVTGAILVGGGAGVTVSGSGTPLVTLTGSAANINAVLTGAVNYLVTTDSPPATDTLTLTIDDGGASGAGGPRSASVSSTITISAANDAPVNTLPGGATTLEDTPLVYSAAGGNQISITDVDAGGAPVQVSLSGSNGVVTLGGTAGLAFTTGDGTADSNMTFTGTVASINAALDGLVFTPNLNHNGLAFIQLTTNDQGASGSEVPVAPRSDTDLATIDVLPVNDAPNGTDTTVALNEDSSYTFTAGNFGFNDIDFGDAMTEVRIDSISLPAGATLMLGAVPVTAGMVIPVASIGTLVFTPVANANGAGYASFTFSVRDTGVPPGPLFDLTPNTMTINVAPVNDLPVITSDGGGATAAFVVAENTTAVTTVTATDIDLQPLTFSIAGGLDAAQFSINATTGVLTFNPAPNFEVPADSGTNNVYDVVVMVADGASGADTQALSITVTDANDAPFVAGDAYTTVEDTPLAIAAPGALANDGDEDLNPVTASLVAGPANGSVVFNADGSFVYTPNANFAGVDSFTYHVSDGALVSVDATITIAVSPVNDAPTAADGSVLSTPAVAYTFTLADFGYADVDGDPLDHVQITVLPTVGALTLGGAAVTLNQIVDAAEIAAGNLQYAAPTGTVAADSFGFRVHDGTVYDAAGHTMTIGFIVPAPPPAPPAPTPTVAPPAPPAPPPPPAPTPTPSVEPGTGSETQATGGAHGGGGGGAAGTAPTPTFAENAPAAAESVAAAATAVTAAPIAALAGPSAGVSASSGGLQTDPRSLGTVEALQARGELPEAEVEAAMQEIAVMRDQEFRQELNKLREEVQQEAVVETRVAASVFAVSTGLSVGYVLWLLRGGVLLASLLSSIPAWRLLDPLPVLGRVGGQSDEDDESLEDMVDNQPDRDAAGTDDATPAPRGAMRVLQAFRRSAT